MDKFTYLRSSVSSTQTDINTRLTKPWKGYGSYGSQTWRLNKTQFFQAAIVSILLYGCTTQRLTKDMEKKLDDNGTRMLRAILNKSWKQHPTKQQLYGYLLPITKTIQVRRIRHSGHCRRSNDELISDILLWTSSHGLAKVGRPARTYIQQLCVDTGYSLEDIPGAMDDRDGRWERVREICASNAIWWWWIMRVIFCKWLISSIWLIDWTLTGATTSNHNGSESNGNEGSIPHSPSSRTGVSQSDVV